MAYGVGDPADDWFRTQLGTGDWYASKFANSLLPNPLTAHGTYCTRHTSVSVTTQVTWKYIGSSFDPALWHSIRLFFRPVDRSGYSPALQPVLWLKYNGVNYDNYALVPRANYLQLGQYNLASSSTAGSLTNCIATSSVAIDWPIGDWSGIRLDCVRQGDDMLLTGHYVLGATACNSLDANGEPAWTKMIEVAHTLGSAIPTVYVGASGGSNWSSITPFYSGTAGFAETPISGGLALTTYYDSIRLKQLT